MLPIGAILAWTDYATPLSLLLLGCFALLAAGATGLYLGLVLRGAVPEVRRRARGLLLVGLGLSMAPLIMLALMWLDIWGNSR